MCKNNSKKRLLFTILILTLGYSLYAQKLVETQNVKVGFFELPGYYNIDSKRNRSGYGYEYLNEMAKSTGWNFIYVPGTWEECMEMLKNGEIDLLTSAQYTEERAQNFDFSTLPMGESYAQLTVRKGNVRFTKNDFKNFNNMTIGILKGYNHNTDLEIFAKEKGFSYNSIIFKKVADLHQALQNGLVDAALTSNMCKLADEHVIAQFSPASFYSIVKKGNTQLLSQINIAMADISIKNHTFKAILYDQYYRPDSAMGISLTKEEKTYLKRHPMLRVVGPSMSFPLFFYEDGIAKGIAADIFALIANDIDIQMEYIQTDNYQQAIRMVANGEADVINLFQSDFNWAEKNNIKITSSYIPIEYSAVTRSQFSGKFKRIALLKGSHIQKKYIEPTYKNAILLAVNTEEEAILALANKKADVAFINTYAAQSILFADYPNLKAILVIDLYNMFSIGVGKHVDPTLYTILDRKVSALDQSVISQIITNHTMLQKHSLTLSQYMRLNPIISTLILIGIFLSIIAVLIYFMFINRQHAKKNFDLAYYHKMTNLWNMNGFELQTKNKLSGQRNLTKYAIVALDIEGFSSINDDYGRETGDEVIVKIAQHLKQICKENTIVAHSSADNFLLCLEYTTSHDFGLILNEISSLTQICTKNDVVLKLKMRIGVYQSYIESDYYYTALDNAKMAHQLAKKQSLSVVYFDENFETLIKREKNIIDHFGRALETDELQVYYQPKIDMRNNNIVGAEALIRWFHKDLGFLSPSEFIPLLEKTGDVVEIDFFVLEQVCIMIRNWLDTEHIIVPISVNQSRVNFQNLGYIGRIQNLLVKYNIPPNTIELEITENLFESKSISQEIIEKIKMLGLCVSVDDFGSGYSSLYLLNKIPIDTLKIDKSLIDDSESSIKVRKILRKIVEMAYDIGLEIVCEGVEYQEQVDFLLNIGCKYAQGFFYSKPVCKEEFIKLLNH